MTREMKCLLPNTSKVLTEEVLSEKCNYRSRNRLYCF